MLQFKALKAVVALKKEYNNDESDNNCNKNKHKLSRKTFYKIYLKFYCLLHFSIVPYSQDL